MKLSPLFIKKQEFEKSMRGYNISEVQAFLEKVASEIEKLIDENEALEAEVQSLSAKVNEFQKIEKNLHDTLLSAREESKKTFESTKNKTDLLIQEAEVKSSQIIENANKKVEEIKNAVINLREEKDLIISRLKAIVSTQASLLESKVKHAGEEKTKPVKLDESDKLDIDVDGIVDKLL